MYANGLRQGFCSASSVPSTTNTVGSAGSSSTAQPKKFVGVVAAQTVDAYYVCCPFFKRDVLLPKHLQEFQSSNETLNLGQWINFIAKTNEARDYGTVLSFSFIDPVYSTMPSFNTIMLECKIDIPSDYNPFTYNSTVRSEFIPHVADKDSLIRECHFGKTLFAVMRRTKTPIPNVFWNIEFIKF